MRRPGDPRRREHDAVPRRGTIGPPGASPGICQVRSEPRLAAYQGRAVQALTEISLRVDRKPTWGTCAGLIVLAEEATSTKKGGQALIGGLDVTVHRNHFGRQTESFETTLALPFLDELEDDAGQGSPASFRAIFIRAPVIARLLPPAHGHSTDPDFGSTPQPSGQTHARDGGQVQVLARLGGEGGSDALGENRGDIVAVRQGNVFGTSFHPELTNDARIHSWWLLQIIKAYKDQNV